MKERIKAITVIATMLVSIVSLFVAIVFFILAFAQVNKIISGYSFDVDVFLAMMNCLLLGCIFTVASICGFITELYRVIAKLEKCNEERKD